MTKFIVKRDNDFIVTFGKTAKDGTQFLAECTKDNLKQSIWHALKTFFESEHTTATEAHVIRFTETDEMDLWELTNTITDIMDAFTESVQTPQKQQQQMKYKELDKAKALALTALRDESTTEYLIRYRSGSEPHVFICKSESDVNYIIGKIRYTPYCHYVDGEAIDRRRKIKVRRRLKK